MQLCSLFLLDHPSPDRETCENEASPGVLSAPPPPLPIYSPLSKRDNLFISSFKPTTPLRDLHMGRPHPCLHLLSAPPSRNHPHPPRYAFPAVRTYGVPKVHHRQTGGRLHHCDQCGSDVASVCRFCVLEVTGRERASCRWSWQDERGWEEFTEHELLGEVEVGCKSFHDVEGHWVELAGQECRRRTAWYYEMVGYLQVLACSPC